MLQKPEFVFHTPLPHIDFTGAYQFVTFRTQDSLYGFEKRQFLNHELEGLEPEERLRRIKKLQFENLIKEQNYLDQNYGECILKEEKYASIVKDCIFADDGDKLIVIAWSIMPNHVHLMVYTPWKQLGKYIGQMKCRSAKTINELRNTSGQPFWCRNYFDRYIRSYDHFMRVLDYILKNPEKGHCSGKFTGCIDNWQEHANCFLKPSDTLPCEEDGYYRRFTMR